MRPALFFLLVSIALVAASDGQAQDPSREMMQSHRIERRVTGVSSMPSTTKSIPTTPALKTTGSQPIEQGISTTQATTTMTLPATPSLSVPEMPQSLPPPSMPSFDTPTATSNIDPNQDPFKPKMSIPSYEAAYMASLRREAEEKRKKKSLMDAIFDEITTYGLYFLLGIVIFLVIYALRKEPKKAAPQKLTTSPGDPEPKKDIWRDDLTT